MNYQFPHFFVHAFRYYLIFGALLGHTRIQIKFEFGFDPLIFYEVMALGLRKMSFSVVQKLCLYFNILQGFSFIIH
jgi:hypothetical protein